MLEIKRNYEALSFSHKTNHELIQKINGQLYSTRDILKTTIDENAENLQDWQGRERLYTGKINSLQINLRSILQEIRSSFAYS
jgi:hypothetical protein